MDESFIYGGPLSRSNYQTYLHPAPALLPSSTNNKRSGDSTTQTCKRAHTLGPRNRQPRSRSPKNAVLMQAHHQYSDDRLYTELNRMESSYSH